MRFAIGVGLGASCLLACSGGVLNVGSNDAGDPPAIVPTPDVYSAAAVQKARQLCPKVLLGDSRWTNYSQADLRSEVTGGWLLCSYRSLLDRRSFQFTADGHWYTLADDGAGGLQRETSGDAGGAIGYQGTYSFRDLYDNPSGADGGAVFVATNGVTWFHPEFTGPLMTMNLATDGSQVTCVRVEP